MARSKDIGTKAETAVVRYLQTNGWPHAERRALRGVADAGDITGTPGLAWSVKGGIAAETASDLDIIRWLGDLAKQRYNANAEHGVLVLKRRQHSAARAGTWWAVLPAWDVTHLVWPADLVYGPGEPPNPPCRMTLADAVGLLRGAGYGTNLPGDLRGEIVSDTYTQAVETGASLLRETS
ncbi:MAG: hypothetical protein ACRDQ7_15660 [Haloechinothrix sp.]